MAPFSREDEENLGRQQCRHQGHKLCVSLPGKATYIFIFLPSVFAFSFRKSWVKHYLVKKEESLPVVKLPFHPWQLGSHELKQIFFFPFGRLFLIRAPCVAIIFQINPKAQKQSVLVISPNSEMLSKKFGRLLCVLCVCLSSGCWSPNLTRAV